MPSESNLQALTIPLDQALFKREIESALVTFHRNERPLGGVAGLLDWRFQGAFSSMLKSGALSGAPGECVYFPITRHGLTYHLILAGAGDSPFHGERSLPPPETLHRLRKNLLQLRIPKIGISRQDFGKIQDSSLSKHFGEIPLWISP